jgi:GTPase involved in cell partitioning and DNA repair
VLADIGGISRGTTSWGENPGARWLAFAQTARLLAFVIPSTEPRPARAFRYLLKTVSAWNPGFAEKERVVVFNRFTDSGACSGPAGEYAAQYSNERTVFICIKKIHFGLLTKKKIKDILKTRGI